MESTLGVGRLTSLELLNPRTGKTSVRRISGKWLVWHPAQKLFGIARIVRSTTQRVSPRVAKMHREFHLAPSRRTSVVDVPSPKGKIATVALIKALTYLTPDVTQKDGIFSPSKNNSHWHHAFGDTGHKGGKFTMKVMPVLCRDQRGNLFIARKPGNIFTVARIKGSSRREASWLNG